MILGERLIELDSVKISGFTVLFIGVAVLLFTFYSAYELLRGVVEIPVSGDLINLFGEALAPLIVYSIRALYLGIMGWIGSILTRRGVQTITSEHRKIEAKPEQREFEVGEESKSES